MSRLVSTKWIEGAAEARERLRSVGVRNLSIGELLALIVGNPGPSSSVAQITARLIQMAQGSPRRLAMLERGLLESIPGIGAAGAGRLLAVFELGRRVAAEAAAPGAHLRGPADVYGMMAPRLQDLRHEEFHAVLLNTRHRVISDVLVTRGILDASLIHPREVFRPAVTEGAAGVVVVHNHPSGDPTPSEDDRSVTRQLAAAGKALGIPLLDHVVVGHDRYVSLADELNGHAPGQSARD